MPGPALRVMCALRTTQALLATRALMVGQALRVMCAPRIIRDRLAIHAQMAGAALRVMRVLRTGAAMTAMFRR